MGRIGGNRTKLKKEGKFKIGKLNGTTSGKETGRARE